MESITIFIWSWRYGWGRYLPTYVVNKSNNDVALSYMDNLFLRCGKVQNNVKMSDLMLNIKIRIGVMLLRITKCDSNILLIIWIGHISFILWNEEHTVNFITIVIVQLYSDGTDSLECIHFTDDVSIISDAAVDQLKSLISISICRIIWS